MCLPLVANVIAVDSDYATVILATGTRLRAHHVLDLEVQPGAHVLVNRAMTVSYDGIAGTIRHFCDIVWHLTLPAVTLVMAGAPAFVLLARDLTAGMQRQEWLIAARAKGLSEPRLVYRHLLPNIIPPLLTLFGLRLGAIAGGAIVVERVFGIPGLGLLGFEALRARDYPVLQALFLVSGLSVLAANFALEIVHLRLRARGTLDHA